MTSEMNQSKSRLAESERKNHRFVAPRPPGFREPLLGDQRVVRRQELRNPRRFHSRRVGSWSTDGPSSFFRSPILSTKKDCRNPRFALDEYERFNLIRYFG